MQNLLEKIRADAAARLTLAPGFHPGEAKARYKRFLRLETHRLKMHHRAGARGLEICRARAMMVDELLVYLLDALARAQSASGSQERSRRWAVVATGGYGRGELNPFSDLDIMFLYDGPRVSSAHPPRFLEIITSGLIFDIGLKVSHAVRSIPDCVQVANSDMQSKTALTEARHIWGERGLFERMRQRILEECVQGHEAEYIQARLQDQAARRTKYGNSPCLQEPHIKNGCGGLRDYQNLLWMAFFKHRCARLEELQARQFVTEVERKELAAAYEFLLRTRNELHYHVNRPADLLSRNVQPAVAHNLGYGERSLSRRVELFMGDYYRHARNIYLLTRTLEQRLALAPPARRRGVLGQLLGPRRELSYVEVDGFSINDGGIQAGSERVFADQPRRLMRVFWHAQQRGVQLHPDLESLIRRQLGLAEPGFRRDPEVQETFLEMLNHPGSVGASLRRMHELGLLGRYLPAFGKLTALVQHEFYHLYTADEHTLVCLEKLDAVRGALGGALGPYATLFQKVARPGLLYLALLLHDTGKAARSRNHVENSARIAQSVAGQLGLDAQGASTLVLLVRHHLAMAQTSQRRDLEDPAEIRRMAGLVETEENLNMLTLLTYVDTVATSDQLWNGFKEALLWTLHYRVRDLLRGQEESTQAQARRRERLAAEVGAQAPSTLREDEIQAHIAGLPQRYFWLRSAREIIADLELAHRFLRLQVLGREHHLTPVIAWHHETERGYSQLKVCAWDRHGLFCTIAGALTAAGLNILSADIFTREDHVVVDSFIVTDALTATAVNATQRQRAEHILKEALIGTVDLAEAVQRRQRVALPYAVPESERLRTIVRFNNESSETRTLIDVETEDRVGLLYGLSQALSAMQLDISLAKICTEKGAAMDTFYVSELAGGKLLDPARQEQVRSALCAAIERLER